jgi:hypothetical protein
MLDTALALGSGPARELAEAEARDDMVGLESEGGSANVPSGAKVPNAWASPG